MKIKWTDFVFFFFKKRDRQKWKMNLNILTVLTFLITCLFVSPENPVCAPSKSQSKGLKQTLIIFSSIKTFVVLFSSLSRFFKHDNEQLHQVGYWKMSRADQMMQKKLATKSSQLWEMINGIHWELTTWSHKWIVCTSNSVAEAESFLQLLMRISTEVRF